MTDLCGRKKLHDLKLEATYPTWNNADVMSCSVPCLSDSVPHLSPMEPLQTFANFDCELKINQFPANKTLAPYHLPAAGRESMREALWLKDLLSHWQISFCEPCLHHTGHRAPHRATNLTAATDSHLLLFCDYQRQHERLFNFRCKGLGLVGEIVFTALSVANLCEETMNDQNRWANIFSFSFGSVFAFRLMWTKC